MNRRRKAFTGVSFLTVVPLDRAHDPGDRPACFLCGRPTYDPDKRETPWVRAVASGKQALVCPECQRDRADWAESLDRCASCGGTRLSAMLGDVVCRACGHTKGA